MIDRILGLLGKLTLLGIAYYAVSNGFLTVFAADPASWLKLLIVCLVGLTFGSFIVRSLRREPRVPTGSTGTVGAAIRAATREELRAEEESRPRRARHEAGHAVVAIQVGRQHVRANVHVARGMGGRVSYEHPANERLVDVEYSEIMIALAGQVLDLADGHHDFGAKGDIGAAAESALTIVSAGEHPSAYRGPLAIDALVRQARVDVERLLVDQAAAVDRVTAALLQQNALEVDELLHLVRPDIAAASAERQGTGATARKDLRS